MQNRLEPPQRQWQRYLFIAFTIFFTAGIVMNNIWWVCSALVCLYTLFILLLFS